MPKYLGDVRCWVNSGKHLLSLSFSGFDPSGLSFRLDIRNDIMLRILGIEGSLSAPLRSADDRHLAMACSLLKVRDFGRILGRGPWLSAI
jgi:hypothetical protein